MPIKKILLLFMSLFLCFSMMQNTATAAGTNASLKLGVNDVLTEIEAVSVKGNYYVPARALAQELGWSISMSQDGIQLTAGSQSILLLKEDGGALLPNGTVVPMSTFLQNGLLVVPVRLSTYLGYMITFAPDKYLLRLRDASAVLDDEAFASRFKEKLLPKTEDETAPEGAPGKQGETIYLTFDDGPSATTRQLLDILDKYEVKATFFMLGPNMNKYPSAVKQIEAAGHGLGLHGMTHRKEKFYASPAAALAEMSGDNAVLKKIAGSSTTLIRPPYGSKPYFTKSFRDKVLSRGYHLWDWNVDSNDWKYKEDSSAIYNTVMEQVHKLQKTRINPVILMHDQKTTLKVLPDLLNSLKKEGYEFQIITRDLEPVNFWKDKR